MSEVIAARSLNGLYIVLDILFLLTLAAILVMTRRRVALFVGLLGGILYFLVDYGIFYLALGTRQVVGADPFWFLLWLSMSYGFTNFAWIWVLLDRDDRSVEWSILIIAGWLTVALMSQNFGGGWPQIEISRGTSSYHGVMAVILFVGYAVLCVHNLRAPVEHRAPIVRILVIGILIQFAWEFILLITGIRPAGILPIVVNSLLETNLGLPYFYLIHRAVMGRYREDGTRTAG